MIYADELADFSVEEVSNRGNRDNSVFTLCRVNPVGFKYGSIYVNKGSNEVELSGDGFKKDMKKSWALDDSVDHIPQIKTNQDDDDTSTVFGSQEDVWFKVKDAFDKRLPCHTQTLGVVCIGGSGSGKSYTLFGHFDDYFKRGIVPRFVDYVFDSDDKIAASFVRIQFLLIIDEKVIDIFSPTCSKFHHEGNLAYSDILGPIFLPAKSLVYDSADDTISQILLGLKACSVVMASECDYYCPAQMVLMMDIVSNSHHSIQKIIFVECTSLDCPPSASPSVDRFTGVSKAYTSPRTLYDSMRVNPNRSLFSVKTNAGASPAVAADASSGIASNPPPEVPLKPFEKSVLTYLLQDCCFKFKDCVLIACLRGRPSCYADNFASVDFINRMDMSSNASFSSKPEYTLEEAIMELSNECIGCLKRSYMEAEKELADKQAREGSAVEDSEALAADLKARLGLLRPGGSNKLRSAKAATSFKAAQGSVAATATSSTVGQAAPEVSVEQDAAYQLQAQTQALLAQLQHSDPIVKKSVYIPLPSAFFRAKAEHLGRLVQALRYMREGASGSNYERLFRLFNHVPMPVDLDEDGIEQQQEQQEKQQKQPMLPIRRKSRGMDAAGARKGSLRRGSNPALVLENDLNALIAAAAVECDLNNGKSLSELTCEWLEGLGVQQRDIGLFPTALPSTAVVGSARSSASFLSQTKPQRVSQRITSSALSLLSMGSSPTRMSSMHRGSSNATSSDLSEEPYLLPLFPGGSLVDTCGRIFIKRGKTLVRGSTKSLLQLCENKKPPEDDIEEGNGGAVNGVSAQDQSSNLDSVDADDVAGMMDKEEREFLYAVMEIYPVIREQSSSDAGSIFSSLATPTLAAVLPSDVHVLSIYGPDLEPLHAHISQRGGVNIRLTPQLLKRGSTGASAIAVNGKPVMAEVRLGDNDIIQLGTSRFFKICIPRLRGDDDEVNDEAHSSSSEMKERSVSFSDGGHNKDRHHHQHQHHQHHSSSNSSIHGSQQQQNPQHDQHQPHFLSLWEEALYITYRGQLHDAVRQAELSRRHAAHLQVDREYTSVAHSVEMTPVMLMTEFEPPEEDVLTLLDAIDLVDQVRLCEVIGATVLTSYWSDLMRRGVRATFQLKQIPSGDREMKGRRIVVRVPIDGSSSNSSTSAGPDSISSPSYPPIPTPGKLPASPLTSPQRTQRLHSFAASAESLLPRQTSAMSPMSHQQSSMMEERTYVACVHVQDKAGEGSWWWVPHVFQERMAVMRQMLSDFDSPQILRNSLWLDKLYPVEDDPFADTLDDELIGVGFLYLDSLQYLLDIEGGIPIINFQGRHAGFIELKMRAWIDTIETQPSYITVDHECNITQFPNRNCVMRLYFEGMKQLPEHMCASTYIFFKFFFNSHPYKTPRYNGATPSPYIDHTISIEQRITRDFIEYIKTGCIELEVFGKRKAPPGRATVPVLIIGEPPPLFTAPKIEELDSHMSPMSVVSAAIESYGGGGGGGGDLDTVGDASIVSVEDEVNNLYKQLDDLTAEVARKDKLLQQAKKANMMAHVDKELMEIEVRAVRLEAEKAVQAEESARVSIQEQLQQAALREQELEEEQYFAMQAAKAAVKAAAAAAIASNSRVCIIL